MTGKAVSGAILVAAVLFMPNGILELLRTRFGTSHHRPAVEPGLDVPATCQVAAINS